MNLRALSLVSALLGCMLSMPIAADAQSTTKVYRIGILSFLPLSRERTLPQDLAFFDGLNRLGYVEAKNLIVELRSTGGNFERFADVAAELVALKPDVIWVPVCGAPLDAARRATRTIPIVVATCTDGMVAAGIVASLARPGGNVIGQQKLTPELSVKRLELLRQVAPATARVAVLWHPGYSGFAADWKALRAAAQAFGMTLLPFDARGPDQWEPAFAAIAGQRADQVIE